MNKKTLIIAEAGINHNGSMVNAKRLIDMAVEAGADVIKFQTYNSQDLVIENIKQADYQFKNSKEKNQFEMLKKYELSRSDNFELKDYCDKKNIVFCSSAFDIKSIELLNEIGIPFWKIPSGEITNVPYLRKIGSYNKKIILSTGMSMLGEVERCLEILVSAGTDKKKITVLHCNSQYPTPYEDVNLKAMLTIKNAFDVSVGYSDHTIGIEVPIAAVALGAEVIEKHFTLDKTMPGPDHKASIEPAEFSSMVRAIHNIENALGSVIKTVSLSEKKNKDLSRKKIIASKFIRSGDILSDENVTTKRSQFGIPADRWDEIIGRKAEKNYSANEIIDI